MTLGSDISNAASTASEEDNEPESPCSAKQQPSSPKADDVRSRLSLVVIIIPEKMCLLKIKHVRLMCRRKSRKG